MRGVAIVYSQKEFDFLTRHQTMPRRELAELFNNEFNRRVTVSSIRSLCQRMGWKAASDGKFKKGNIPSLNARQNRPNKTSFKRGNVPHNAYAIGKVSITTESFAVKIKNPNTWIDLRKATYVSMFGDIPEGHFVVSLDGNRFNLDPDNLMCVDRRLYSAIVNLRSENKNLTRATIQSKKLQFKIKELANA